MLDYLEDRKLIHRSVGELITTGQFVLVEGTLVIFDVGTFKGAWDKESVKSRMINDTEKATKEAALIIKDRGIAERNAKSDKPDTTSPYLTR